MNNFPSDPVGYCLIGSKSGSTGCSRIKTPFIKLSHFPIKLGAFLCVWYNVWKERKTKTNFTFHLSSTAGVEERATRDQNRAAPALFAARHEKKKEKKKSEKNQQTSESQSHSTRTHTHTREHKSLGAWRGKETMNESGLWLVNDPSWRFPRPIVRPRPAYTPRPVANRARQSRLAKNTNTKKPQKTLETAWAQPEKI